MVQICACYSFTVQSRDRQFGELSFVNYRSELSFGELQNLENSRSCRQDLEFFQILPARILNFPNLAGRILNFPNLAGKILNFPNLAGKILNFLNLAGKILNFPNLAGKILNFQHLAGKILNFPESCGQDLEFLKGCDKSHAIIFVFCMFDSRIV